MLKYRTKDRGCAEKKGVLGVKREENTPLGVEDKAAKGL